MAEEMKYGIYKKGRGNCSNQADVGRRKGKLKEKQ